MADMEEGAVVSNPNQPHTESPRKIMKLTGGDDRISYLPDEILQHILSYIPTKLAITTSVLSKRWEHIYSGTPSISIDCSSRKADHLISISKTLSNYSASKFKNFDLTLYCPDIAIESQIDSWINLAISKNTENLSFTFNSKYTLPVSFFHNSTVKQLTVWALLCVTIPESITNVSWTSLRRLSLHRCGPTNELISNILSGCSLLQSLTLSLGWRFDHLDLTKSLHLTRLKIIGDHIMRGPVKIIAPHVRYLSLELVISKQPCVLMDVSSVTEAKLILCYFSYAIPKSDDYDFLQDMLLKILTKLENVEKLTLCTVVLQLLSLAELRGVTFPQLEIKNLIVEAMVVRSVIPGIVRLLQNSPRLNKLTVHTKKQRAIPDEELEKYLNTQGLNPDKYGVDFPTVDAESKHVASFVELLLQKAKTLETLVLRLDGCLSVTEYQKLLQMVSSENKTNIRNCVKAKISMTP